MAYDHRLANDIRRRLEDRPNVTEREMFGGIAFMVNGNMAVGVIGDDLLVRVGKESHAEALSRPGTRVFDMTSRPMTGWIVVSPDAFTTESSLEEWIDEGCDYAAGLPPK